MSLIFMDGMYYPTADILLKYSSFTSGDDPITIDAVTSRVGPGSVKINPTKSSGTSKIQYAPSHNLEGCFIGRRFKVVGTPFDADSWPCGALQIHLTSGDIVVEVEPNFALRVEYPGGVTTTVPNVVSNNVWSYIELGYTKAGAVTLKVNEVALVEETGLSTNFDTTLISMYTTASANPDCYFQDLYILDGIAAAAGPANNDFLGDVRVDIVRPDAPGTHTDFTPSAGANWENVDEVAMDSDTTYNKSEVVGDKDTYGLEDILLTGADIFGIQQHTVARKDDASIRYIKQLIKSGATEDLGTEIQLSDNYVGYQRVFDADPNTDLEWTESGVNALESGIEVTA